VLQKSIQFEATRYLPSAAEEHLIGFHILPTGTEEQMEVLLVAAPRSTTDPLLELVEKAGLEPQLLELQPFAALRTVQAVYGGALPYAYALVDLGGEHTQITVARNATLVLTRFIPIASNTFSAALKGYFNYPEEEAEQVKRGLNLEELLQTGQPQEKRLFLYGGGAQMHGAAAYFEHKLGIPTQLVNPFEGEAIAPSGIALEQLDAGARWATVLGNALAPLEMAQPFAEPMDESEPAAAPAAAA
jgi:Tfp pilus assembly PilM family ATPase